MTGEKLQLTDAQWRERLTPEQYAVMRQNGTERPFSGQYDTFYEDGVYKCAGCGETLFDSDAKFSSGSGWPSFTAPAADGAVGEHADGSFGMRRVEVTCTSCGAHLGHVFNDGPIAQGGMRYCINSAALEFDHAPEGA